MIIQNSAAIGTTAPPLTIYRAMKEISEKMVEAAKSEQWDDLTELEVGVAGLRNQLPTRKELTTISEEEKHARAALIRAILQDDREVRRLTEPWMDTLRQFLVGASTESRVRTAYKSGTSAP